MIGAAIKCNEDIKSYLMIRLRSMERGMGCVGGSLKTNREGIAIAH